MNFEEYLISKRIDSAAFLKAEPDLWKTWSCEFEQVHPNSFTVQKFYLINPTRRKYHLKQELVKTEIKSVLPVQETSQEPAVNPEAPTVISPTTNPKPAIPRPVFKPKPKIS